MEPRHLRPSSRGRADPLQLSTRLSQVTRLIEQRPSLRVAAACSNERQDREREDLRHRPSAVVAKDEARGISRLVPAPPVEVEARAARQEEEAPQVEPAFRAVLKTIVEESIDQPVPAAADGPPHEVQVGAAGVVLQILLEGKAQRLLELSRRVCRDHGHNPEVGEGVDLDLHVPEPLSQLEGP